MTAEQRMVYEFGEFTLEVQRRRLLRRAAGTVIPLTAKVFDTLLYLVEHRGEVLDKGTLLRTIWPELVVEENNLTQNISTLRQALGEAPGENKYIATVARRGYQFVAAVRQLDELMAEPPQPLAPVAQQAPDEPRVPVPAIVKSRRSIWIGTTLLAGFLAASVFWLPRSDPVTNPLHSKIGGTQDAAAYLLYSNGRYALAQANEPSLNLAIGYFEQAIARDPKFALAHSRLAECFMIMGVFGMRAPADTFPRARDSLLKALQVEPRLAPAYATLGHIKLQYDRDWDGAEADFHRAIALDASIAEPRLYLGVLWVMRGELDRGLEEIKVSQQLEPLLTLSKTRMGSMLYFARRFPEAEQQLTESLALDDRPAIAHRALGRVYLFTGRYELALAQFAQARGVSPGSYADVAQALALSGRVPEARAELARVLKLATQRYVSPVDIASIYASLGEADDALLWLNRALEQRAATLGMLPQNPAFDSLHGDARFVVLVQSLGLWKKPLTPSARAVN